MERIIHFEQFYYTNYGQGMRFEGNSTETARTASALELLAANWMKQELNEPVEMVLYNSHLGCYVSAMTVPCTQTGDARTSADAIAKKAGVEEVYAQLLPEDKVEKLKEIRQKNGAVMFVGDGINDAPVLAGADVGAAMGTGADAAIEAADVVFMTSSMEAIPQSVTIAKATAAIAMQNVVFALIVKGLVMILGLMGFANMWLAVFADTGVAMLCVLNSIRILYKK